MLSWTYTAIAADVSRRTLFTGNMAPTDVGGYAGNSCRAGITEQAAVDVRQESGSRAVSLNSSARLDLTATEPLHLRRRTQDGLATGRHSRPVLEGSWFYESH